LLSQVDAGVKLPVAQLADRQIVVLPYFSHAPLPSQWLVLPHDAGIPGAPHRPCGSSLPDATTAQVPSAADAVRALRQEWHASVHEVSQHTPSTQFPVVHSAPLAHVVPFVPSPLRASVPPVSLPRSTGPSDVAGASEA
jgi:hypothetical protein